MKNKTMEYYGATLLCCLCAAVVAGNSNLKIFRNIDGSIVEVPSKVEVEVPNGANLTLICQIENIKSKRLINGYVTWFIPPKIHSELKLRAWKNSCNLVFSNVNTNDEGLYVCASLKFKNFKTLHLLVKHSVPDEPNYLNLSRLTKREVLPGNEPYGNLTELKDRIAKLRADLFKKLENNNPNLNISYYNDTNLNEDERNFTILNDGIATLKADLHKQLTNFDIPHYDLKTFMEHDKYPKKNSFSIKGFLIGILVVIKVILIIIRLYVWCSSSKNDDLRDTASQHDNVV